jgi:T5SS/PEP-CTERM-associated repeat protein
VLDNARFISNASYQVSWTIDGVAANAFLDAASGTVTQAIGTKFWLLANSYVIGPNSGSTASVALVSGTLRVTNSARTGMFEVRRGTNRLNAGLMEVDRLVMTNAAGKFEFNGGTLITRGAAITNASTFNVGTSNGTAAVWDVRSGTNVTRFALNIGRNATNSLLLVTNGGRLISSGGFVGFGSFARSNVAIVAGAGSIWDSGNDFDFGGLGIFNQVVISNAGAIFDGDAIIGNGGGSSNTMSVIGVGSVWSNSASLAVYGSFNQLTVSGGGHVSSGSGIIDGSIASGSHNTVFIDQAGSLWDAGILYVGNSASFNQLALSNGAVVVASEMDIGFENTSTNNRVVVSAGTLAVTNPVFTAPLDIVRGTNQLNSGLIEADRLLMTNTLGTFEFNGGTLNVRASTVSNAQVFFAGNGSAAATLNLVGNGAHSFANGLTIRSNASLIGNGTISGTLTVQSGGTLNVGSSPGTLNCGNLTLNSGATNVMELNGTTAGSGYDQLNVTGTVNLSNSVLKVALGFTPAVGNSFTIIANDGADAVLGTFSGLPQGALFTNSGALFSILYTGGDGNDVALYRGFPPARLSAVSVASNHVTQIQGLGLSNLTYTIQAASNLNPVIQWSNLGTSLANSNGVFSFTDTNASSFPIRFYRALSP